MPRLTIDNQTIEVPDGATLLDAARQLGLDIPALCYLKDCRPNTSCMLCLVKVDGTLVPSCATPARDGMAVESETPEIRNIRRTGLELLLSDHAGDCVAPCRHTCPTHMDIPLMLQQVASGAFDEAITTIRKDIALPATLGRVCPDLCEGACRRRQLDTPAAIGRIAQYVADKDLASTEPVLPTRRSSTGKTVAIIGAGPAGLSAAYHLQLTGHACTLFDDHKQPGGRLRYEISRDHLPENVLDSEIALIEKLGVQFRMSQRVVTSVELNEMRQRFDAVLLAIGRMDSDIARNLGLKVQSDRLDANTHTHETNIPGVFAAGRCVRPSKHVVRSVADGRNAAVCIDQYLSGEPLTGIERPFTCHIGRLGDEEITELAAGVAQTERMGNEIKLTDDTIKAEAARCLHCDCGKQDDCKLRHYAALYSASPNRYRGQRRHLERRIQQGEVVYEPGKCILCGLCVQIATDAAEPLGLTFIGRGFDVRVDVPFDESIAEALKQTARQCAKACPTGAISLQYRP